MATGAPSPVHQSTSSFTDGVAQAGFHRPHHHRCAAPGGEERQPRLGPLTLIVVEVLHALFIDFPLAVAYVATVTLWQGRGAIPRGLRWGSWHCSSHASCCIALAPTSELLV